MAGMLFEEFLRIAGELNRLGIIPTLMGSLGLQWVTETDWQPGDIDIHVPGDPRGWDAPDEERIYNFAAIERAMLGLGYVLVDRHEHEFRKEGVSVEFGTVDTLPDFAGIDLNDLRQVAIDGVHFTVPTPAQYLQIYRASSLDSYRNEQNNDKDFPKIAFLEELLAN